MLILFIISCNVQCLEAGDAWTEEEVDHLRAVFVALLSIVIASAVAEIMKVQDEIAKLVDNNSQLKCIRVDIRQLQENEDDISDDIHVLFIYSS